MSKTSEDALEFIQNFKFCGWLVCLGIIFAFLAPSPPVSSCLLLSLDNTPYFHSGRLFAPRKFFNVLKRASCPINRTMPELDKTSLVKQRRPLVKICCWVSLVCRSAAHGAERRSRSSLQSCSTKQPAGRAARGRARNPAIRHKTTWGLSCPSAHWERPHYTLQTGKICI